jgi:hypothetical protein
MACRNLQLSRCEEWELLGSEGPAWHPFWGCPKRKNSSDPKNTETFSTAKRAERYHESKFFQAMYGLVSTKNKALSIKRA